MKLISEIFVSEINLSVCMALIDVSWDFSKLHETVSGLEHCSISWNLYQLYLEY